MIECNPYIQLDTQLRVPRTFLSTERHYYPGFVGLPNNSILAKLEDTMLKSDGNATNVTTRSKRPATFSVLLRRAFLLFGALLALYSSAVLLVMTPWIQTHVVYAHRIDYYGPTRAGFSHPEDYGLAPGKAINLRLHSPDGISFGAWFILSEPFYRSLPYPPDHKGDEALIRRAIAESPTLLYLHGNTGTRAFHLRTAIYTAMTSRLSANILAIDYRGFADSDGHPTVSGVAMDARTAWDWLTLEMGARAQDVVVVGHSLGTAIAGLLGSQLGKEGIDVRGVALLSPFSSIRLLMDQYALFGIFPLLKPLAKLPFVPRVLTWSIAQNFDTLAQVSHIAAPVFVAHAVDDADISYTHAEVLFNAMLEPYLPTSASLDVDASAHPAVLLSPGITNGTMLRPLHDWDALTAAQAARAVQRDKIVKRTEVPHFGVLNEFEAPMTRSKDGRKIALLTTQRGGHDLARVEGVQDVLGRMFGLIP
ncbi:hypothetical protein H0H92_004606 [Tricholoma furcatifolium]|nr:hypothetical protein H0H92_004606 [Tricholoma furcatifolium]